MTSTSKAYLVLLEDAILALIGVSAGLTASLELSICCVHFKDALSSPVMDEQLFGRLYAATAGVDDPGDSLLHERLPREHGTGRNDLGNTSLQNYSTSIEEVGRKRDRHCRGCFPSAQMASEEPHTLPVGVGVSTVPPGFLSWETSSDSTKGGRRSYASLEVGVSRKQPPCLPTRSKITTWKSRFKANLATRMRPTEFFSFPAQRMGSQDVLMSVVPSIPPTIAVTCTTELSLFALDGTRINPTGRSVQTSCTSGTNQMDPSDHPRAMAEEAHDRDIRCLAVSTAGDRVATGSLDCTILVRSVSNCPWVRRLKGHRAGIRCLVFHGTRLVSADSLGVMSVWDIYPDTRRLHTIQGHSDSVQVLTRTGGGEFVASGALDGRVAVWSVSTEGTLSPVSTYDGFGHPYRLASVGRSLVFTSSSAPSIQVEDYNQATRPYGSSGRHGCDDHMPSSASTGSYVSIVGVSGDSGMRVSTGQARVHHLVAGLCIGAVMVSPAEPWGCETDCSSGEDEVDPMTQNSEHLDSNPRICRFRIVKVRHGIGGENNNWNLKGNRAGSTYYVTFASEWVTLSQDSVRMSPNMRKGDCDEYGGKSPKDGDDFEGSTGALATCAVFVGTTVFLGYDTGCVWAHRVTDGRRLYRLRTSGPLVHLVEADGSLYSYDSTGTVSIWMWGGKM